MATIDIGAAAINRSNFAESAYATYIGPENPANLSGTITSIEIWAKYSLLNCEVATFEEVDADTFTTRDAETLGTVDSGSKQTFSGLGMDVEAGDYIGAYFSGGSLEADTSGDGVWYCYPAADYIPCTNQSLIWLANYTISLYGAGATGAEAPTVTTQAASDVGTTTATGNGNITDTGGENCDHRGIVYGKTSKGDPGNTAPGDTEYDDYEDEADGFGTGAFIRSLTGLDQGTKYYARAYAHNSAGYSYGDEVDFTTNKSCQGSEAGSGADVKAANNPQATLVKAETGTGSDVLAQAQAILERAEGGSGVEALLDRALVIGEAGSGLESLSSRIFASAEVGSGAEVSALLAALIGTGETGLGTEFATKIFSVFDSGIGIDAVITRLLAANEAGSALEAALLIIALISGDGGLGSDLGTLLKAILASDEGSGFDARRALIEIPTTGSDMRLPPSPGQAGIPSKEVNL